MKTIRLAYGKKDIELKVPDKNFAGFYEPKKTVQKKSPKEMIEAAMKKPVGPKLETICKDKRVCCLIEDGTRLEPHELIIEAFAKRLKKAKHVLFMITTGTHTADTPGNRKIISYIKASCKKHKIPYDFHIHDCRVDSFDYMGKTRFGTEVHVNSRADQIDLFLVGSDAKNHYFSGYSNPIKNFLPGISAFKTVEHNHSLALHQKSVFGRHPLHPDKNRRKAPVAEDQYEAMKLILKGRKVYVLGLVTSKDKILYAKAGWLEKVTPMLFKSIDQITSYMVKPQRYVVVSPGHYPNDGSLYVSQRALELTKNAMKKGGEILFFSECKEGITYDEHTMKEFYLPMKRQIDSVLRIIKKKYVLYSHKAYRFAELIRDMKAIYIYSDLEKKWFTDVHLSTTKNPQEIIDNWIKKDKNAKILFFNEANKLAVYSS
ncbi:hypothetical protein COV93_04310 [Candidatus Woesearchaeota archaeon CG11_big_fil_rev_8_21_14_0_20_43_8]|nr:MAG: hypothetical protein COV93_04310 [Candidatus Woesearchaeota archaeon CG11_big_fil_rev_8_21_14_0_20_43_8]PIO07012.1 MAG: hypothetical protein COT47_01910 [Candidatus Woesearchaeota archaeon CG08_land_8_20_14_0_20_43_7]